MNPFSERNPGGDTEMRKRIIADPAVVDDCDLSRLSALDWAWILRSHPELEDRCEWGKFDAEAIDYYGHPLYGNAWHCLLVKQPQFASRCDWRFATDWDDVDNKRHNGFSRWYWVVLLNEQPQFADKCDWGAFDGYDVSQLARLIGPDNQDAIQWSRLNGEAWGHLLAQRPDLVGRCDFDKFTGADWVAVLLKCEALKDYCEWGKLEKDDWQDLVAWCPAFEKELKEHSRFTLEDIKVDEWEPF